VAEIKAGFFGLPATFDRIDLVTAGRDDRGRWRRQYIIEGNDRQQLARGASLLPKYAAASTSTSRAIHRLHKRGLIEIVHRRY
jgi:hypothetical protein